MRNPLCILTLLVPLTLAGCDDLESTGVFRLDGHDGSSKTWLIPDAENVGGGPAHLDTVSSDIQTAWFALGKERSAYLFDGNLAAGIESGGFLALPAYDPSDTVVEDDIPYNVVEPDRPTYESFRVYDSGACSINLGWEQGILPPLIPAFSSRLSGAVDGELAQCDEPATEQFSRTSPATIEPVFRARAGGGAGALGIDDDVIRYTARYNAPSVGGCAPVNLDISFEFGFREGPEGGVVGFIDPESVSAEVAGFCIVENIIENKVRDKLIEDVPAAVEAAVRNGTRLDPGAIGLPTTSCGADSDCEDVYLGTGHTCNEDGQCEVQFNVDRVNVRPEGVELILMEFETDPQRELLGQGFEGAFLEGLACGPDRNNGMLAIDSTPGTLMPFSAPVTGTASSICDGG